MFADTAKIILKSGKGGDGHVSFHREKFVAAGGPDGGDGGKGGDVIFVVDKGLNTLYDFRHKRKFAAQNGEEGKKSNCSGKKGEDLILKVPAGTVIKEAFSGKVIADMSGENTKVILLKGGKGGLGNQHFATSRMQVPKYAQPGQEGIEVEVILELKVIADVGLVGFPNVGKSTLLSRVTNARPKIANYHFTTLHPNLGVVDFQGNGFVIADIPGLIEGAANGQGLGHDFLRHIERTRVIVHVVDAASTEGRDPIADIYAINKELKQYDSDILNKPVIIAANKVDAIFDGNNDIINKLKDEFEKQGVKIFPISAVSGEGINELIYAISEIIKELPKQDVVFEQEYFPEVKIEQEAGYTVEYNNKDNVYLVEGPAIDKMLGYTNLDSEKGFLFFQQFLTKQGIVDELKKSGIQEGDTVRMYGHEFEFYDE